MINYHVPNQVIVGIKGFNQIIRLIKENKKYKNITAIYPANKCQYFEKLVKKINKFTTITRYIAVSNSKELDSIDFTGTDLFLICIDNSIADGVNRNIKSNVSQIRFDKFPDVFYSMRTYYLKDHLLEDNPQNILITQTNVKDHINLNYFNLLELTFSFYICLYRLTNDVNLLPVIKANYAGALKSFIIYISNIENRRITKIEWACMLCNGYKMFADGMNNDIDNLSFLTENKSFEHLNDLKEAFSRRLEVRMIRNPKIEQIRKEYLIRSDDLIKTICFLLENLRAMENKK